MAVIVPAEHSPLPTSTPSRTRAVTIAVLTLLVALAVTLLPAGTARAATPSAGSAVSATGTPTPPAASRGYTRVPAGVRAAIFFASLKWAARADVERVRVCESGNNYRSKDAPYYGAYQFLTSTWRSMGGTKFAKRADLAPKWAQDYVAYSLWRKSGWRPWACKP